MNPIKIIFFDIDGTLIDPATGKISSKTVEALRRLKEKGILRCVVTGRPPASLPDFGEIHFDVTATFNGSFCCTETQTIYSNPLPPATVDKLLSNIAALGRPVSLALRDRLSANGVDQDLADYYAIAGLTLTADPQFEEARKEDVYQIMLGCRDTDHPAILRGTDNAKIAVSWERAADVIPSSGGKGSAIAHILDYYGLSAREAMAFGDNQNDIEMLQAVGNGIAMGNAVPQLKAIADAVCRPVQEDGIYHYCLEHGLID